MVKKVRKFIIHKKRYIVTTSIYHRSLMNVMNRTTVEMTYSKNSNKLISNSVLLKILTISSYMYTVLLLKSLRNIYLVLYKFYVNCLLINIT